MKKIFLLTTLTRMSVDITKEVVFFIPSCKNYPYEEIYNHIYKQFKETKTYMYKDLDAEDVFIYAKNDEEFRTAFNKKCIVNNSVKYKDTVCPLSLEAPLEPVILNLNGRVYSENMLLKALETTVCQCKPLTLPDITIKFRDYDKIKIYRFHDSKNKQLSVALPPVKKYPAPDVLKSKANDTYVLSEFLVNILQLVEPITFDTLTQKISTKHELVRNRIKLFDEYRYEMADCVVSNKTFCKGHSKASLDIINVHFFNCRFLNECYCGQRFISCTFERCILTHFERSYVVGCDFKKCLFEKYTRNADEPLTALTIGSGNFNNDTNIDNRLMDCKLINIFYTPYNT